MHQGAVNDGEVCALVGHSLPVSIPAEANDAVFQGLALLQGIVVLFEVHGPFPSHDILRTAWSQFCMTCRLSRLALLTLNGEISDRQDLGYTVDHIAGSI